MATETEKQKKRRRQVYTAYLYQGPWADKLKERPQDKKEAAANERN